MSAPNPPQLHGRKGDFTRRERTPRLASLSFGFRLPWEAARLIVQRRSLLFWGVLPIGLTLLLYVYVVAFLRSRAVALLADVLAGWGLDPEGVAFSLATVMATGVIFLFSALSFAFTSSLLASPFNDRLAARAEAFAVPPLPPAGDRPEGHWRLVVLTDLVKSTAAALAAIAALLLCLVPIVNLACFVLAFLLVCLQYTSYPQVRRAVGLRGAALFLWRHLYACTGFGAAISVLFALPVISSLALPAAVVGGTLLAARAPGAADLPPLR